jgi:hypothetical protein
MTYILPAYCMYIRACLHALSCAVHGYLERHAYGGQGEGGER